MLFLEAIFKNIFTGRGLYKLIATPPMSSNEIYRIPCGDYEIKTGCLYSSFGTCRAEGGVVLLTVGFKFPQPDPFWLRSLVLPFRSLCIKHELMCGELNKYFISSKFHFETICYEITPS